MSDNETQLHHCEHCAAVFSAPKNAGLKVSCSECGQFPVATSQFVSRAKSKSVKTEDSTRGVAGKDIADFVSMQRVRRKKQMQMAVVLWGVLILAAPAVFFYFKQSKRAESDARVEQIKLERSVAQEQKQKAFSECYEVVSSYLNTDTVNERSSKLVGGVKQLLKLELEMEDLSSPRPGRQAQFVKIQYLTDGEYPRVEGVLEGEGGKHFEMVLWRVDDEWKLDWEQYRRFNKYDYKKFLSWKSVGIPLEFKLYMRRRYSASKKEDQDFVLLFYKPTPVIGERLEESSEVVISVDHPLYSQLKEHFRAEPVAERTVGGRDGDDIHRVTASLSFVKNKDGEPTLQLDSISAFHWMAFEPKVEK